MARVLPFFALALAGAALFAARSPDAATLRVALAHAAAPERVGQLEQAVRAARPQAELELVTALGPVVGTHAGPGAVGLFWFDDRE
jgi:fatty acid-binding protein DegV